MIKFLSFDNNVVDAAALEEKLRLVCTSVYKNGHDQFFVNYQGSCKTLYDNIVPIVGDKHVLLLGFKSEDYWGYQDKSLWTWINENK